MFTNYTLGIKERKEREKEELRGRILKATADILVREGYEGTTIRKVAAAIEYSPRTVYLYFRDKDALLMEIIEEGFAATLKRRSGMGYPDYSKPGQVLVPQILANIQLALDAPNFYRAIVYLIQYKAYPPGPFQKGVLAALESDLQGCYKHAGLNAQDTSRKAAMIFATLRGFNLMLINEASHCDEKEIEQYKDLCVVTIMQGIAGLQASQ